MACEWLGIVYRSPSHHGDATLPESARFKELLAEARQADPNAPAPITLNPGETFTIGGR